MAATAKVMRLRRRPSAPYATFTGYIVLGSLIVLLVLTRFIPNGPTIIEEVAAQGVPSQIAVTITPGIPTPSPEAVQLLAPPTYYPTITPLPEPPPPPTFEPYVAPELPEPEPVLVQQQPQVIIQQLPPEVIYHTAQPVYVEQAGPIIVQTAQPVVNIVEGPVDTGVRQPDGSIVIATPETVSADDFAVPDPQAKCQFVGCLP